jgi:hypothetical protein
MIHIPLHLSYIYCHIYALIFTMSESRTRRLINKFTSRKSGHPQSLGSAPALTSPATSLITTSNNDSSHEARSQVLTTSIPSTSFSSTSRVPALVAVQATHKPDRPPTLQLRRNTWSEALQVLSEDDRELVEKYSFRTSADFNIACDELVKACEDKREKCQEARWEIKINVTSYRVTR